VEKRQRAAALQNLAEFFELDGGIPQQFCERRANSWHLLSAMPLLKIARAQRLRHLETSQFTAPVVSHRRAMRD
jgi:hypothetical protein